MDVSPTDLRVQEGLTPSTDPRDATLADRREHPHSEPHRPTRGAAPAPLFPSSDLFRSPPISLHSPSAFFEHQAEITDSWTPTEHFPGLTITTTGPRTHPPGKAEPARRPPRRSLPSPSPRHVVFRSVPPLPPDPIFHSSEEDLLVLQQEHPPAAGPRDLTPADHPPVKAPIRAPGRSAALHTRHPPTRSAAPPPSSPPPILRTRITHLPG